MGCALLTAPLQTWRSTKRCVHEWLPLTRRIPVPAAPAQLVNHISNVTDSHPDKLLLERLGQALGGRQRTLGRNAGLQAVEGALLRPSLEGEPSPPQSPSSDSDAATSILSRAALSTQLGLDAAYARVYDSSGTERGLDDNHVTLLHGVLAPDAYAEVMRASGVTTSHASLAGLQQRSLHGRPKARWTLAQVRCGTAAAEGRCGTDQRSLSFRFRRLRPLRSTLVFLLRVFKLHVQAPSWRPALPPLPRAVRLVLPWLL